MSSTERILEPLDVNGSLNSRAQSTLRQHGIRTAFWIFVRSRLGSYDITRVCGSVDVCKRAPIERLAAFAAVELFLLLLRLRAWREQPARNAACAFPVSTDL